MTKKTEYTDEEKNKANAIMHAIEVKTSFELYAYRIISHEEYQARITELVEIFQSKKV